MMYYRHVGYVEFPEIKDKRGRLTYAEGENTVPFAIKRVYYIYNIPDKETKRGGHAHKGVQEVIVPVAGRFEAVCDNGMEKSHFHMERRNLGLYVPELVWTELFNFSGNAICLVLSSECYDEANYVRKYADFVREIKKREKNG